MLACACTRLFYHKLGTQTWKRAETVQIPMKKHVSVERWPETYIQYTVRNIYFYFIVISTPVPTCSIMSLAYHPKVIKSSMLTESYPSTRIINVHIITGPRFIKLQTKEGQPQLIIAIGRKGLRSSAHQQTTSLRPDHCNFEPASPPL